MPGTTTAAGPGVVERRSDRPVQLFEVLPWGDIVFNMILKRLSWTDVFQLRAVSREYRDLVHAYINKRSRWVVDEKLLKQLVPSSNECIRPIKVRSTSTTTVLVL